MSKGLLWDSLKPLAAKMSKVVREHEILRIAAGIPGTDRVMSAETARHEVLMWVKKRSGRLLPKEAWSYQGFEHFSGGRNSVGIRLNNSASDIWAIRADDPDKTIPGRVWTTEIVVGIMGDQPPRLSARLLVSTSEGDLDIEPHTQGFVQQIVETCGLWCGPYELSPEPWLIDSREESQSLVDMLLDQERRLPVFVLTTVPGVSGSPHHPLLDASALARATLGIGHVVVLPSFLARTLTDRFGKQRSVFGGAVRAYLPGFAEDADPYDHRLILADQLQTPDGSAQCNRWMRSLAATESVRRTRLGTDVLAFAEIRNASLQSKQQQLEQEGASDSELLSAAKDLINALEKQIEEEKATLEFFSTENEISERRALAAEDQLRASAFRIQQLISHIEASGDSPEASIELPSSWSDFTNWCDRDLAGLVALSPAARRGVKSPEFEDVELAARCLIWLAKDCRDRRISGGDGSLREEAVEEGIRNAHCGNDQFDLNWEGQRQTADWHIKNGGNTRDPKRCLRIYYFWDAVSQRIVIAEMPAHRRTEAS